MIERILGYIEDYQVKKAFWAAAKNVEHDEAKQELFLQIIFFANNVAQLQGDAEKIKALADGGNPYMQMAYARLHDVLQPEKDSNTIKEHYYKMAANNGIGDAYVHLAYMYRDADLGEIDPDAYKSLMAKGQQHHSERAMAQAFRDSLCGANDVPCTPEMIYEGAKSLWENSAFPHPTYLMLMGEALEKMNRKDEAIKMYQQAAMNGCSQGFYRWAIAAYCNENYQVEDREEFMEVMQKGIDVQAADCYTMYAILMESVDFDALSQEEQQQATKTLYDDLRMGWMLGESTCAYFLGTYFENGTYGFERNAEEAWLWYSRGANLRCAFAWAAMSHMALHDHTAPEGYGEERGYECAYRALALGNDDLLDEVIAGYRSGFLSQHTAMIEKKWLPQYHNQLSHFVDDLPDYDDDDDDDGYNDNHEYQYDGEPEREVDEDDCSTVSTDLIWQACMNNIMGALERVRNQEREWEVAGLISAYLNGADDLLAIPLRLDDLYSANDSLLEIITDHPRLKLRLLRCQLRVLREIEAEADHELGLTEDVERDVRELSRIIDLADEGRLNEIPQTGHLKRDPVEWTEQWEAVIDEADRQAYSRLKGVPRGMGFCFSFWHERQLALHKLGVVWRNPHQMNPRVMFD